MTYIAYLRNGGSSSGESYSTLGGSPTPRRRIVGSILIQADTLPAAVAKVVDWCTAHNNTNSDEYSVTAVQEYVGDFQEIIV